MTPSISVQGQMRQVQAKVPVRVHGLVILAVAEWTSMPV